MQIGIIGSGRVARAFARKAIASGHDIALSNSRGPESLALVVAEMGLNAHAVSVERAAALPVVLLAIPWAQVETVLSGLQGWAGRILIDATNGYGKDGLVDFGNGSSSESVAALCPGSRVVKAMNAIFMENFEKSPVDEKLRRVLFLASDDRAAADEIADLFESFGFAPIYLGTLARGGRMQAVGATLAGHDLFVPWPAPRSFPAFNGEGATS